MDCCWQDVTTHTIGQTGLSRVIYSELSVRASSSLVPSDIIQSLYIRHKLRLVVLNVHFPNTPPIRTPQTLVY